MAGTSFLALLDDIASLMDDVAVLTKVATKQTAGVLGDDLALNAQQVAGVSTERELPVVWAVAKGSLVNKAILVPLALAISAIAPWGITPLLMVGGLYLCFEGVEKIAHKLLHSKDEEKEEQTEHQQHVKAIADPTLDVVALEKAKIAGAIRTDFVLSAEIVVIALGSVATQPFLTRVGVMVAIALVMTAGVYGVVAAIVKLDDLGLAMTRKRPTAAMGRAILWGAPFLMKALSIAGTVAMFLVGGGILVHGTPWVHLLPERLAAGAGPVAFLVAPLVNGLGGILAGILALVAVEIVKRSGVVAKVKGLVTRKAG